MGQGLHAATLRADIGIGPRHGAGGSFLDNLKISRKLLFGFGVLVVLVGSINAFTLERLGFLNKSSQWQTHTYEVLGQLDRVLLAMVNQETGLRGYLVAGDTAFLEPYNAGVRQYETAFGAAKTLTADNAKQQARLDRLNGLAMTWRGDIAEREIALMGNPATQEQARAMESSGAGKASMDGFRALLSEIANVERDLLSVREEAQAGATTSATSVIVVGSLVTAGLFCLLGLMLAKTIARPIGMMTAVMHRLAAGDVSAEVPSQERGDEIGKMAQAVEIFRENAIERIRLEEGQKADAAALQQRGNRMTELSARFEATVGGVAEGVLHAAGELDVTAKALGDTLSQTAQQARTVADGAEQVESTFETIASAAAELSSSISEIRSQVTQSAEITSDAVAEAGRTNIEMGQLAETSQRIGTVVGLIRDIAEQTNLLALNATIEAARAGEAGKGFAVVATEVKSLAEQTGKATEDITQQISGIQAATRSSVTAIEAIGQTVERIAAIASSIAASVEEQGAATEEIARNASHASSHTRDVTANIKVVSASTQSLNERAAKVRQSSADLSRRGEDLRKEVGDFVGAITAL
ncbi:methyl-accepting chemotaxis protein [Acuticoccus mangrovi]|uniref:Methyl-accepting chemotaxis protein n=1 Tax=Acuticoccus mangrovi TaxID=2796142 RepID=A0A934IQU4_9HYPH|nr:CHASE3 domain-containing protein [Acuticoccus mangrovi]MBJ3778412.1 methyl-accepting chemotaxis protein [Acuticoccus mangrovi]